MVSQCDKCCSSRVCARYGDAHCFVGETSRGLLFRGYIAVQNLVKYRVTWGVFT